MHISSHFGIEPILLLARCRCELPNHNCKPRKQYLNLSMPPKKAAVPATPKASTTTTTTTAPSPAVSHTRSASASNLSKQAQWHEVALHVWNKYLDDTPKRTMLLDVFMLFLVLVGAIQFLYCLLVGNYVRSSNNILYCLLILYSRSTPSCQVLEPA